MRALASPLQITERLWQATVVGLAKTLGWSCYHTWLSVKSQPGFPDLVLIRPAIEHRAGRVVFAELKSEKREPSEKQIVWLALLRAAGAEVYVWRPSDAQTVADVLMASERPEGG